MLVKTSWCYVRSRLLRIYLEVTLSRLDILLIFLSLFFQCDFGQVYWTLTFSRGHFVEARCSLIIRIKIIERWFCMCKTCVRWGGPVCYLLSAKVAYSRQFYFPFLLMTLYMVKSANIGCYFSNIRVSIFINCAHSYWISNSASTWPEHETICPEVNLYSFWWTVWGGFFRHNVCTRRQLAMGCHL